MTKENLKIEVIDKHTGMILLKILDIEPVCFYCKKEVTEKNFGGVFTRPDRTCCEDILCLSSTINTIFEER